MAGPQTERLRGIKTLPQLIAYLRDELDWPIESNDTENVTFDYEASELGLDEKSAVRIKEIKQLRPLSGNQPWGIFFVNFEKKRLPVMVMRRILRSLVFKKRTTAGKSERQAWNASDLLFVSAYGEESDRAITFAHFVEDEDLGGLAELRVLGWDDDDTPLKYDYVAHTLHEKLRWRDEYERKPDEWRNNWRSAFELRHREVITTSKQLASQLADLAKKIRARVRSVLRYEDGFGQIRKLHNAFKKALIHDLSDDDFADMYAQTITYGLFSAAVSRPAGIHGENIVDMVPVTNPFLRDMLQTFLNLSGRKGRIDFDELGIQEVVALLNSPSTHLDAVLRDFGNRTQREDPVIHFYEDFLREYDARKKIQRGVFYTPQPVVSYIVRSVHELLQTEFGLEDGLADTTTWKEMAKKHADLKIPESVKPEQSFVQVLDPATGTATFLVEVIDVIHRYLEAKWNKGGLKSMPTLPATSFPRLPSAFGDYWNQYVALALLPRLHGYELMMAPYAIAHMKIGLKLFETGYRFGSGERARIYLTNTLEPAHDFSDRLSFDAPALAHEAEAVNAIKRGQRFTVIIGNPPYSNLSANLTDTARALIEKYKFVDGERVTERNALQLERNLNDDYVKFIAWSETRLRETGLGVLSMISNNVYTWSPSLRGMRGHLVTSFASVRILDLHGASQRGPSDSRFADDENVFDIEQPVAIGAFYLGIKVAETSVEYADMVGNRATKYQSLLQHTSRQLTFVPVALIAPARRFVPSDSGFQEEYDKFPSLTSLCPLFAEGIKTGRDWLVTDFSDEPILQRMKGIQSSKESDDALCERIGLSRKKAWNFAKARSALKEADLSQYVAQLSYRPFDERNIFYHPDWIASRSAPVMRNLGLSTTDRRKVSTPNLAILAGRISRDHASHLYWCSRHLTDKGMLSSLDNVSVFPALVIPSSKSGSLDLGEDQPTPNLSKDFLTALHKRLGLEKSKPGGEALQKWTFDIFNYLYAILWAPSYRLRYGGALSTDFPRLPLTENLDLFRALARLGGELVALHLLESPKLDKPSTEFLLGGRSVGEGRGGRNPEVEKISWSKNTVWIDKAQTTGFKGVPEAVWNFHIGGYQVCEKWLKDRKGRTLTKADIAHYHKIVIALAETIPLMAEIDKVIEKYGGWPAAFVVNNPDKK